MRSVLVTGSNGFIGRNIVLSMSRTTDVKVIGVDIDSTAEDWDRVIGSCNIVFHLAGINRPKDEAEFEAGNIGSLMTVLDGLARIGRRAPVVLASSTQALFNNPYGHSKKSAGDILLEFAHRTSTPARIFRLPGVFGKWCRPNYNSVVATFCFRIARDLPIEISDSAKEIEIVHVDDVVAAFKILVNPDVNLQGASFLTVQPVFHITLGELAGKLREFKSARMTQTQPNLDDPFDRRLYGTYISYLPEDKFDYELAIREDARGALAEFLKLGGHGQLFISRTHPGFTRGDHYHDLKVEKFVVLEGQAVIRFRHMAANNKVEYPVDGREMRVVDIPPGWTHSIENVGISEMVVLFWSSEVFNPVGPDTYFAKVRNEKA